MKIKMREKYMSFKFKLKGYKVNPYLIAKKIEESQYWERDQIENHQLSLINEMFKEAKRDVKFYGNGEYNNLKPFKSLNDFKKNAPVLFKDTIKNNTNLLVNKTVKKRYEHETSGSTGIPMRFQISDEAESYRYANNIRFYHWWDLSMFDRNVLLWKVIPPKNKSLGYWIKKVELKLMGRMLLNVFDLNENSILDYFNQIEKFKPKYIRGYKSGVYELARLMEKKNLKFTDTKLKVAIVTSETLEDFERKFIEKVLQCKVANEYGSAEAGLFSAECPHGSLHINEESVFIYTDENQLSYVTELFNKAMPLINYRNEDKVTIVDKKCSCGRNLKVMESVNGRIGDFIHLPDGSRVQSFAIGLIMGQVNTEYDNSIKKYKTVQSKNNLEIEIIPGSGYQKIVLEKIQDLIKSRISKNLIVNIKEVNCIAPEKSGKLRSFIRLT